jgi:regulator of protease activity HflC (stomatin/prohibitin superfamily)
MGKLKSQGFGGGYFLLPFIDELIVLPTTVQTLEIAAGEVITRENQDVRVNGFVIWRIEDPVKSYQSISGQRSTSVMNEINHTLSKLVESIIRTTVARLSLDQVLRERSLIIEAIMSELVPVVEPMGIRMNTAEIRHVDVVDTQLFSNLQETYRQEAKLNAEKVKIVTNQEIAKQSTFSEQQIRLYTAEQQQLAGVRELQKEKEILLEQQKLNETEQKRLRSVQELEKRRETSVAEIAKEKLQIEAETKLMQIELEAESMKRQSLLQQIDVEAEKRRRMAEAEADAVRIQADAEAYKLEQVAQARKRSMQAEAEGRKSILLAEADGLREKVKAQGHVNEAMLMQELINQLPSIASSMKVGEVNWLNMPGNGENGESPLGIIPKNITQVLAIAKNFGLDVSDVLKSIKNKKQVEVKTVIDEESSKITDDNGKKKGKKPRKIPAKTATGK